MTHPKPAAASPLPAGTTAAARRLGRGPYTVLVTAGGTGGSACGGLALTPWSGDPVEGDDGLVVYLRDREQGTVWTAGRQPLPDGAERCATAWTPGGAVLTRAQDGLESRLEICVPPGAAAELRRLTLANRSGRTRVIEATTAAEVALHDPAAHAAHPVFSKLFLQTEHVAAARALLVRRRARSPQEHTPWLVHALVEDAGAGAIEVETDRARFLGRRPAHGVPHALVSRDPLSGTTGNVLDPVVCLRRTLTLRDGEEARLTFLLGTGHDRDEALALAARFAGAARVEAAFKAAADDADAAEIATEAAPAPAVGAPAPPPAKAAPRRGAEPLRFDNGHGGFSADGTEYVIRLRPRPDGGLAVPPQPWINVIANEEFGFLVSETGAGYTWHRNSREHRLTPWSNDPLRDPHGEAYWVRDEATGACWSPLPGPTPGRGDYEMRHGFGYSVCRHDGAGLEHETTLFAARRDPVRATVIRLTNRGAGPRELSLVAYCRLDLGVAPAGRADGIRTARGDEAGLLLAHAVAAGEHADQVAFAAVIAPETAGPVTVTTDRAAFLGPGGSPERPAAVAAGGPLDGRIGTGADPCFAQRVTVTLAPGEAADVTFLCGETAGEAAARELVARLRGPAAVARAFVEARDFWSTLLSGVRVSTPSPALDLLLNGWLAYQTLACRLWGRSAFYQSGGAFGYRDQLQDAASLVALAPGLARAQIVLHAAHQFTEGDVLHWWHPPGDRGLRTRFADDLLWLPLVAADYVAATGDAAVLDEPAPFLAARLLAPGEDEAFLAPARSGESADVYEHCCRALDRGLTAGAHGLPLFGTGDWNDGLNRVGREGRGESVWMGFFLHAVLGAFAPLCARRGDAARADRYLRARDAYRIALDEHAWDGDWYRRGWYDDGAVLGSRDSDECRIDALAQAWAVLSGAAPPARAALALDAVERELISARDGLIRLLAPPFDRTPHDPGYIRGYVPGVRENGGQYTHVAAWVVKAMAAAGRRDRAAALLELLNPINHALTPEQVAVYRVEPYVICADVYGAPPHVGRGGWTWYTGSSGWYFRVALESLLGLRPAGVDRLAVRPCIPDDWPEYTVDYRLSDGATTYAIRVVNPDGCAARVAAALVDGAPCAIVDGAAVLPLARDGGRHDVAIRLGAAAV